MGYLEIICVDLYPRNLSPWYTIRLIRLPAQIYTPNNVPQVPHWCIRRVGVKGIVQKCPFLIFFVLFVLGFFFWQKWVSGYFFIFSVPLIFFRIFFKLKNFPNIWIPLILFYDKNSAHSELKKKKDSHMLPIFVNLTFYRP